MPDKKPDLIKMFGLEGKIDRKEDLLRNESYEKISSKRPNEAASEIRTLLDQIAIHVHTGNLDSILECIDGIEKRNNYMRNVAIALKKRIDNSRKE